MNLNHLHIFHAVANSGSVTLGAERLMVSQPAVSKQIGLLERALKTKLFERHARGVRLTASGEILAGYARRIFALADEAHGALDDLAGLRTGRLAIGASTTLGVYLLPKVLVEFRRQYPGVQLHLEIENAQVLQQRLEDGLLDLGLTEVGIESAQLSAELFMQDDLIAVASPRHPLAKRRSVAAKAICQEPFITRETGSTTKSLVERTLAERGLLVNSVLSLSSTEAIKQAVSAGLGVAIISRMAAQPDLRAKRLVELRVSGLNLKRPIHLVRLKSREQSNAANAFLEILKASKKSR